MNHLIQEMEDGKLGKKVGITTGSKEIDEMILGIRKGSSVIVAAKEKVGKSKWTRYHFIVQPYLNFLKTGQNVNWVLFSLEEPRVKVEADIISALIYHFYGQVISRNLILGTELKDGKPVIITPEQEALVHKVYFEHIELLFGKFDREGTQLEPGMIEFYGTKVTPTQYEAILIDYAKKFGNLVYTEIPEKNSLGNTVIKKVISNFVPHTDTTPIVIVDDLRLLKKEGGNKETVDAALDVGVNLTQTLKWFFILGIIHLNRENTDYKRIEAVGKNKYYPDSSLIKDTGNAGERAHFVITIHDPQAPGFETPTYFNQKVLPGDRSIHLVASRDTEFPRHCSTNFNGATITFQNYKKIG